MSTPPCSYCQSNPVTAREFCDHYGLWRAYREMERERDFYREGMIHFRTLAYGAAPLKALKELDDKYFALIEAEELAALLAQERP